MARGVSLKRPALGARIRTYAREHLRILISSLGRLYRVPVPSLMTMAVIGIALALPSGLYVMLINLQSVAGGWDNSAQISLFLKLDTSPSAIQALSAQLRSRDDIARVRTISAGQALREFRTNSGMGNALDALDRNPLPPVLVVTPAPRTRQPKQAGAMLAELKALPEVDLARLDMQWLQRLYAIMRIARRVVTAVGVVLALGVLLVVGNTIRLDIHNRREEIEVTKLIGATDAFIRRPFLYRGLWYGLLGGVLAWLLVSIALALVSGPAQRLAVLYNSHYQLLGLGFKGSLALLAVGGGLGLSGSWLAVGRHLGDIEPR